MSQLFVVGNAHFRVSAIKSRKPDEKKCIVFGKNQTGFGRNELRRNVHVENMRVSEEEDERVEGKSLIREQ